jgi:hypothetical protein
VAPDSARSRSFCIAQNPFFGDVRVRHQRGSPASMFAPCPSSHLSRGSCTRNLCLQPFPRSHLGTSPVVLLDIDYFQRSDLLPNDRQDFLLLAACLYGLSAFQPRIRTIHPSPIAPELTLNAKFFNACATPGLLSNLLPAFTTTLIDVVGCPLSIPATLTPDASETVAYVRAAARADRWAS